MNTPRHEDEPRVVEGTIRDLDLVQRGMLMHAGGELLDVDVPADCAVVIRDERVKFRLLQEADHVRVTLAWRDGRPVAQLIEVGPTVKTTRFELIEASRER